MQDNRIYGFNPIIDKSSQVLILGSLPGKVSLEKHMYFADRGNYFWKFMAKYLDTPYPENNEQKVCMLMKCKVALWDVYKSGIRINKDEKKTSNDSDITDYELNDIKGLIKQFPQIERIGIAGKKAYSSFTEFFPDIDAVCLPSTSGSNGNQWGNRQIAEEIDINKKGWIEWTNFLEDNKHS